MPILTPEERIGQVVGGRYRLDALLSVGGMGVLFRAFDRERDAAAAVKMLKPAHALEPDRVARFAREARIACQVTHPNIARTLDAFCDESGTPFLVMELLEGRTLAQELDERGVLATEEALAIMLPIVSALQAMHALGIVHRDLKPSNLFLARDADGGVAPKLIDFGIAKAPRDGFDTQTGVLLGTPGYMAPEQVQYAECSVSTDIWGVGAVLYRCLAGHAPHVAATHSELLQKLVREPVPPLAAPGASRALCATIDRALARDPHRRYASMQAFGSALAEFAYAHDRHDTGALRGVGPDAPPRARTYGLGRWPRAALGVTCVLAISAFGASGTEQMPRRQPNIEHELSRPAVQATASQAHDARLGAPDRAPAPNTAVHVIRVAASTRRPRARANHRSMTPPHDAARVAPAGKPGAAMEREATSGLPVATEW